MKYVKTCVHDFGVADIVVAFSEGYGFAVEGCEAFVLGPGEVRDVRIAFRPDFSSSMVKRDLLIATSQGTHSFPLVATLPYDLLPLCVDSQPHGTPKILRLAA
jgi:hypothetical protein